MDYHNHLKCKPMQCICNFVQSKNKSLYEILAFLALIVVITSLLIVFSTHNFQSNTKPLSMTLNSYQLRPKSDVTTSDISNSSNVIVTMADISEFDVRVINMTTMLNPTTKIESDGKTINITKLKLKSIDLKKLVANLSKSHDEGFTKSLSASQINEISDIFALPSLKFSDELRRQFLDCSGVTLLRQSVKEGGILHIPKHFQTCKNMTFQKTGNFVGLLSWPGSGNSWVRQMLETATGIYTGAWYCDSNYINAGMLGEGVKNKNILLMKIHFPEYGWVLPEKVMYLVRNPFDCIVAEWNRIQHENKDFEMQHTATVSPESFGE